MGEIYKILQLRHYDAGDIYPFLGEDTVKSEELYG
jgi:hypothetical protein